MTSVDAAGAGARRWPSRARALLAAVRAFAADSAARESGRLFLWSPVALGAGAATYLSLPFEPFALVAPAILVVAMIVAWGSARFRAVALAVALFAGGVAAADWRAARLAAPALDRELPPRALVGRLLTVDEFEASRRLVIALERVDGLDPNETPARARIAWKGERFDVRPGDRVELRAGLSPPSPPVVPGGFDLARHLYFQRIGAVGFAVTPPRRLDDPAPTAADRWRGAVENLRLALTRRILAAAPGDGGAFVAASITGKRAAVSAEAYAALRDSGLAHLIAISGLNMAIATGLVFFAVRFALAAVEPIALRWPIKKIAALAAFAAGLFYLLLAGSEWSAERAFIMVAIVFLAILVDRRAFTLRNVAIAALVMLVLAPEAVIHPGFQMSFAATTALIAAYEWHAGRLDPDRSFAWPARLRRYFLGVMATDAIASTATAPFSLFHFNRVAVLGLPANVVAVPLTGLVVMPAAVLALALAPLGLDAPVWRIAAAGADCILFVGRLVSGQEGAVTTIARWPPSALVALSAGGLWLCLQTAPWRLFGLVAVPFAALLIAGARSPDLLATVEGENVLAIVTTQAGPALAIYNPRKDKFDAEVFKEAAGLDPDKTPSVAAREAGRCDPAGCVLTVRGRSVAVSADPMGLGEDCARADLVIALYRVAKSAPACRVPLLDRSDAREEGAHAIRITPAGDFRIRSARRHAGARPWQGGDPASARSAQDQQTR
jgi:competence protein ComEC